jgi:two-component system, NarL family, response regulator NreC
VVADGHPEIRRLVIRTLKEHSRFEVVAEAKDGVEAVEKAVELKADAVVLDVILPVLNGFDSASRIRKSLPEVAIVILSSHADSQFISEAKKIGVRAYIPKSAAAVRPSKQLFAMKSFS